MAKPTKVFTMQRKLLLKFLKTLKMRICHKTTSMKKLAYPNIVQFNGILSKEGPIMLEYKVFDLKPYSVNDKVYNL